jgi:hypothetical protein
MPEILVQFPPESMPWDTDDLVELWGRLESWVNETLAAGDLGRSINIDFSSELTAWADVKDADRAVERLVAALDGSGLPPGAVIAEQQSDEYHVRYPPERAGQLLDAF